MEKKGGGQGLSLMSSITRYILRPKESTRSLNTIKAVETRSRKCDPEPCVYREEKADLESYFYNEMWAGENAEIKTMPLISAPAWDGNGR
ncbi:unnamed protein product [Nezara viridula]|uniref:Uncharacterized protein n=1 Tax=Nezara viridula TaxID=85310 RepID=A0A9P0HQ31_NEZVI|nr:unnamed protein product [Nezara viridula]